MTMKKLFYSYYFLLLIVFNSCFIQTTSAQNNSDKLDIRDNFVGTYQRINSQCEGAGPSDYTVTKHPTQIDYMYIVDGSISEGGSDPYKHKIKINSDSTWSWNSIWWGNFKKNDTLVASYAPVVCGIFTTIYAKKITTSIDNLNAEMPFSLFPNPFSTQTTLQTYIFLKSVTLTVYNLYGQQVKQIKNISGQTITLHRDNLACGLYIFRLTQDNKIILTDKFIITDN